MISLRAPVPLGSRFLLLCFLGTLGISAFFATPAQAQIVVTTAVDELDPISSGGTGISLREAIRDAVAGDLISFNAPLDGETIALTMGPLELDQNVTIVGSLPSGITIDANSASRVMEIEENVNAILIGLTLRGGRASAGLESGGAILNHGNLTLLESTIRDNYASQAGGGIAHSGAGPSTPVLIVGGCTFVGNAAGLRGGAIETSFDATAVIQNCTFFKNQAASDGGGAIWGSGTSSTAIVHATITGNLAGFGGGIGRFTNATILVENSIVAGNTPDDVSPSITPSGVNFIGGDPKLSALGYFGGPTPTMHPLVGSPVIDNAAVTASTPTTDQRDYDRNVRTAPDIGAVEAGPLVLVAHKSNGSNSLRDRIISASFSGSTVIAFDNAVFPVGGGTANTISLIGEITVAGKSIFIDASDRGGGSSSKPVR